MRTIDYHFNLIFTANCTKLAKKENHYIAYFFIAVSIVVSGCRYPPSSFDFDNGSTQNWKASATIIDDMGNSYTPSLFTESHFEAAQYPNSFPGGDPLNDKKGCLSLYGSQFAPWAKIAGFPSTSAYWEISASFNGLYFKSSTAWQGIKGINVAIGDDYGTSPGHLTANIGIRARIGGQDKMIRELNSSGKPLYHAINHQTTGKWSYINAKLNVPANAEVYLMFIMFRGDWKNYKLYDGAIMIDQIEPVY